MNDSSTKKNVMENKEIQYSLASVRTGNVLPAKFKFPSETEANDYRERRPNPNQWKVVKREVTYGEWEDI